MSLYFIRHGESQANKEGFLAGQLDIPITEVGIAQARLAGRKLKASGVIIDIIISSPLKRAYDTAAEVARGIGYPVGHIVLNPKLIERNMGFLQGKPVDSTYILDTMNEKEQEKNGVETETMLRARAKALLEEIEPLTDKNILLVGHTGFGRRILGTLHEVDFHQTKKFPNGEVVNLYDRSLLNN